MAEENVSECLENTLLFAIIYSFVLENELICFICLLVFFCLSSITETCQAVPVLSLCVFGMV